MSQNGIPSVNLADFLSDDPARKQKFVNEIGQAYEEIGFVALKGHFLSDELVENLYKALDKAISMPQWRQTAAQNAYDRLNKYFTWDAVSDELIRIARGEK